MQVAMVASLPNGSATASALLLLLLIIGGFAALFMAAWAFGRAAAIALAALGSHWPRPRSPVRRRCAAARKRPCRSYSG